MGTVTTPVRLMVVAGTRPEAIKLAPVVMAARARPEQFSCRLVGTGQHRHMLRQALAVFGLAPDVDLNIMQERQTLAQVACRSIEGLDRVFSEEPPDIVFVQGDTLAVAAGALAAFFHQIPVGHVEAGLRTGNVYDPFPEEMNRRLAGKLCTLHFAPTELARRNLLAEGVVEDSIYLTGNTATDAVRWAATHVPAIGESEPLCGIDGGAVDLPTDRRWIVVTAHRRENIPDRLRRICVALRRLCERGDVAVIFAVHPNPAVREIVRPVLGEVEAAVLIEPPDYAQFARLLAHSSIVITDSGGIQEEAPSLGKPVLVVRETTERPEGVDAGVAKLVGTDTEAIVAEATRLLDDEAAYASMVRRVSPYGDGRCSDRILDATLHHFGLGPRPAELAFLAADS